MKAQKYYKLARPDGWDFHTGKTINYRANIGRTVLIEDKGYYELCTNTVIHASRDPNDCFVGAYIPCSAYEVWGIPVIEDAEKCGFTSLKVVREITNLDELFGWKYSEVINPINPLEIAPPIKIHKKHLGLLKEWIEICSALWRDAGARVGDYIRYKMNGMVKGVVARKVEERIWKWMIENIRNNYSKRDRHILWSYKSMNNNIWAYIGSLFFNVKWGYFEKHPDKYPFQSLVKLWKMGLIPSFDGEIWRLHGGSQGKVLWEGKP
ncbi:hypothetical protein DRH29_04195 [candidate division Kazan bacterium]|mgnify:CR=1 FL=1|uniref:Uncharacterized protein n=1 Tax=candidate division Kazan bacterium TaxID=2202143 RepID=A0A420ZBU6_UNCK3|nr:MAG: hypothetical protein DRH29_04195 [candidate division Kazan bacterium]